MKTKSSILFILAIIIFIFYQPFFTKGFLPIPSDILTGVYYPWLDIKYDEYPSGIPVKNATASDIVSLTYPLRKVSVDILKRGYLPLWNPNILTGVPLLAGFQSAALYPLNILYFLSNNFSLIWSIQIIIQPILLFIFMYIFLKNKKFTPVSSFIGSLVWAFSGFFSIWQQYNTVVHCYLYLPLLLFSIDTIKEHKYLSGILISICIASSIYAGNPPISFIIFLFSFLYALFNYYSKPSIILYIGLWAFFGLVLSTPVIIPYFSFSEATIRSSDQVASEGHIKYLLIHKLLTFIAPSFFGHPSTLNYWEKFGSYDNLTIYLGILPLISFIASLYLKKDRFTKFWITSFFICLLLMIKNPLSILLGNLPFLGLSAMVMTRFTIIATFSTSVLLTHFLDSINNKSFIKAIFKACTILILIVFLSLLYVKSDQILPIFIISLRNSVIPIFLSISIAILLVLLSFFSKSKILYSLLIIITIFDLNYFFKKYNSFTPKKFLYPQTPTTTYLETNSQRFITEPGEVLTPNTWLGYNLKSPNGQDTLHSKRYSQFISLVNGGSLKDVGNRYVQIKSFDNPFINFLAIDHIVAIKRTSGYPDTNGSISIGLTKFEPIFHDSHLAILKNSYAYPIIYSVPNFSISSSLDQTEKLLRSLDLRKNVVLEKQIPDNINISDCIVSDVSESPNSYSFSTNSKDYCLVTTSISFHPSWHLYINNKEDNHIYISNHAFMSFLIPPGQNRNQLGFKLW